MVDGLADYRCDNEIIQRDFVEPHAALSFISTLVGVSNSMLRENALKNNPRRMTKS